MALVLTLLLISATPAYANIGSVTELRGQGEIVRGKQKIAAASRLPVDMRDMVRTGNGRIQITFQDNSVVRVTEQSKLVIDEFVYDPKTNGGKMGLRFAQGTARFIGGKMNRPNINLRTPTATIGVRGTDFTATVDETGKSMFILLPGEDGHIGEITVSTAAGIVVLNRAFQSTTVTTSDAAPTRPVILDISLSLIDNMIIVSPPPLAAGEIVEDTSNSIDSEMFQLAVDFLKDDSLSDTLQTGSGDELGSSAFEDSSVTPRPAPVKVVVPVPTAVATVTQTVAPVETVVVSPTIVVTNLVEPITPPESSNPPTTDIVEAEEEPKYDFVLVGTNVGYDPSTAITTTVDDTSKIMFYRETTNIVSIKSSTNSALNILINDNNEIYNVVLNNGTSVITIVQKD